MRRHHELGLANIATLLVAALALGGAGLGVVLTLGGVIDPLGDADATAAEAPVRAQANLLECPGEHIVDEVFDQDLVYVVGFDPTGDWAAVRRPGDLNDVGWISANLLDSEADLSSLPVRPCSEPLTLVAASEESEPESPNTAEPTPTRALPAATTTPGPTTTPALGPTTTPTPTPIATTTPTATPTPTVTPTPTATPMPAPTPPADTTAPILVDSLADPDVVYPAGCSDGNTEASVYITAAGETAVTASLSWTYLDSPEPYSGTTPVGDPESSGSPPLFQLVGQVSAMPDPYPYPSYFPADDVTIVFTWSVTDGAENTRQRSISMKLGRCL